MLRTLFSATILAGALMPLEKDVSYLSE